MNFFKFQKVVKIFKSLKTKNNSKNLQDYAKSAIISVFS